MKTHPQNRLAIFKADWKQFPSKAISLLEIMREFKALKILEWDYAIQDVLNETQCPPLGMTVDKKDAKRFLARLNTTIGNQFQEIGWKEAGKRMDKLLYDLESIPSANRYERYGMIADPISAESIAAALSELQMAFHKELASRKFAMIENQKGDFLEHDNLFGELVGKKFPSAAADIKEAGNCLAVGLDTAAVFHLMRVVEYGLRALATKLNIPIPADELEYAQWQTIIDQIYTSVRVLTNSPPGSPKEKSELREFYNGVMSEFSGFKDVWRNNIMHTRGKYNEFEAKGVFERVHDFMKRLATKVSESPSLNLDDEYVI